MRQQWFRRPSPRALRAGTEFGHPRPIKTDMISVGQVVGRVIARLQPGDAIELKLHQHRYRIGGTAADPWIERWHVVRRRWLPVAPGEEEAEQVLRALSVMQWHARSR